MALLPEQQLIGSAFGYTPMTVEEGSEPADISYCSLPVQDRSGWPYVKFKNEWYGVPTMEEIEEMVFDSVCTTPEEDEVEPDHPHSWLFILGMI